MEDARAALKLYLRRQEEWEEFTKRMEASKTSFGPTTSLKNIWETLRNKGWSSPADMRVRLVGQIGSINTRENVTFFDLKGHRLRIQVMDKNRTHKLENGQIIGVEGKMIKGENGYPLVEASHIRTVVDVGGEFSQDSRIDHHRNIGGITLSALVNHDLLLWVMAHKIQNCWWRVQS